MRGALVRFAVCAAALAVTFACGVRADSVPETSACRDLKYSKGGPARAAYLPCAGEIMATLEQVERHAQAALKGDREARGEGRAAVRRVTALMKSAGGLDLLDRWNDRVLTDLNLDIHNAVTHYDTFYMMPLKEEPHPFAAKMREAAGAEMQGGRRNYLEARVQYRRLGGR